MKLIPKKLKTQKSNVMKKLISVIAIITLISGCDVQNPGPIEESSLDSEEAVPGLVVGMSADLSFAYRSTTYWGSIWADEQTHSGTFSAPTVFSSGEINSADVDPWWEDAQRARWVAEDGIERIEGILGDDEFNNSPDVAKAYLYAGYSNRMLGENACNAVIDGGERQPNTVHFERAEEHFSNALTIADNLGDDHLYNAALAGRASVRAALGNWTGAANDAVDVPIDYVFEAVYSINSARENNDWPSRTTERGEYTVWDTQWEGVDDPRLPQEVQETSEGDTATAANGTTPWITQMKYPSDDTNIALSKGTEMLLIRAEMELRENQDFDQAMDYINQGRDYHGLSDLSANDLEEAWGHLQDERGKDMWLEGRRFWDLRRWYEDSGPANNNYLDPQDKCVPIGQGELDMNENL